MVCVCVCVCQITYLQTNFVKSLLLAHNDLQQITWPSGHFPLLKSTSQPIACFKLQAQLQNEQYRVQVQVCQECF